MRQNITLRLRIVRLPERLNSLWWTVVLFYFSTTGIYEEFKYDSLLTDYEQQHQMAGPGFDKKALVTLYTEAMYTH